MKTWTIKSTSNPENTYSVSMITPYHWECTCPDFTHRHQECKHIKGVQKAYDKQITKSKPAPTQRQTATVQSDDRGHGNERDSVPSGELCGSDSIDGESTGIQPGNEPDGDSGYSSSGEDAETSLGAPDAGADVPGPAEGGDQTPPPSNQRICDADIEREQAEIKRQAELKAKDDWTYRKTRYSVYMWNRLQELRQEAKENPGLVQNLKMKAIPIKLAIKLANQEFDKLEPEQQELLGSDEKLAAEVEKALF